MPIYREIKYVASGDRNSRSQIFFNNYFADTKSVSALFYSFEKPMYYTYGGTLNYYGQDQYSIFTNLVRPPIRFVFTANTTSLSGDSYFVHEIYRLDYDTYKLYSDNQIGSSPDIINKNSLTDKTASTNRDFINSTKLKLGNNSIITPEKFFGEPLTKKDFTIIQNSFTEPILTITASTSAITGMAYDLFLGQYIKQIGKYKTELFLDKSQFFINTKLVFNVKLNKNYYDSFDKNASGASAWNDILTISSLNNYQHTINTGPFSGINVIGNYFSYFIVPDKPKLEYPIMTGTLTTFTPEFRWSNGENADSFLIQISYNTGDTVFTGTTYNYPVEKNEKNSHTSSSKTKGPDTEFVSDKTVYTFQIPVKSNSNFIYRVGNSKELIDIFNIRRNIITFTDYFSASSQPEPIRTYVQIESDSPSSSGVTGLFTPPSLEYESDIGSYFLSGITYGGIAESAFATGTTTSGIITGATMQLIYPNNNFITLITDSGGTYSFNGLGAGSYTLITNYRGYQQDLRVLNITENTTENIKINLLWGNTYDTWGQLAGDNYYNFV